MITFVLPLESDKEYDLAFNILLPSFFYYKVDLIYELIIIHKKEHYYILTKYINNFKKINNITNFKCIDENSLISEKEKETYNLQMYLKLIISSLVSSKYYVTLDADVIFTSKFNYNSFFINDKPFTSIYDNVDLLTKKSNNLYIHKVNHLNVKEITNQPPFIFVTDLVKDMLKKIDVKTHFLKNNCSEYTLYFAYLNKYEKLDNYSVIPIIKSSINQSVLNRLSHNEVENFIDNISKDNFMIVIQSRLNYHYMLINKIQKIVPNSTYKAFKISMLTVAGGKDYIERYNNSFKIKKNYCKYNNYTLYLELLDEKKDGWFKLEKLLGIMKKKKDDFIFVSDADVTITNKDKTIESIIKRYYQDNIICYLTTDRNSINSGNIIWKVCDESIELLEKILKIGMDKIRYTIKKPFIPKGIYEQPSIIYLYNTDLYFRNKIKIIPQFEMNSYCNHYCKSKNIIENIEGINNRCVWEEDDLLIHYAGANYEYNFKGNFNIFHKKIIKIYEKKY